jgi:hypothetical protein
MGWAIGFDERWGRDIGYGVPAVCDHPECNEEIDRGLSFVCANSEPRGGEGCGLYFCEQHRQFCPSDDLCGCCERCNAGEEPFTPTPDVPLWVAQKAIDPSWAAWRASEGLPEPESSLVRRFLVMEHDEGELACQY